jgi:hypothetical protein
MVVSIIVASTASAALAETVKKDAAATAETTDFMVYFPYDYARTIRTT